MNRLMKPLSQTPWYVPTAVKWLDVWLTKNMIVFETGSGGSTLWLAQRVKSIISFENNILWYQKVKTELETKNIQNVDLRYEPSYNINGIPLDLGNFDAVFVDGRGRVKTIMDMRDRVLSNGILLLDNSERPQYKEGTACMNLDDWECLLFTKQKNKRLWQTTIYKRKL